MTRKSDKSLVLSALMFVVEFFSNLFKELKKRNVTEEMIFDALKSKKDLIPQMAEKIADLIAGAKVSISSFFQPNGPCKLYFGDNFKNWILSKMTETFPESPKSKKNILPKRMIDEEIIKEFKIQPYKSIPELLSVFYDKITKQPNGEDGELLNNGYANLFYLQLEDRVVVVSVGWYSDVRGWFLIANDLSDFRSNEGRCVFSAADL